ncbi:MAG: response regulator [Pirellulaceae bacterium]
MTKILVVDDNPLDRTLMSALLGRMQDWTVETVNDGQQAMERLGQQDIDIVVTDLQMPNMDGLALVKNVRTSFNRVPVVLVTAFGSERESIAALRAGAANFSHKSRLQRDLVPTVRNVLEWSASIRRIDEERDRDRPRDLQIAFVLDNNVSQIRNLIETFDGHLPPWAKGERLRISMALEEALTNAICHGNLEVDSRLKDQEDICAFENLVTERQDCEPFCQRRVRVKAEFSPEQIVFQINDEGPGFDVSSLPDPTAPENIMKPSGRGLLLIRTFMDEVSHNETGNRITLVKRRPDETEAFEAETVTGSTTEDTGQG